MAEEKIFKVGDKVSFKVDYEGYGEVVHVTEKYDRFMGFTRRTYFIASPTEPNGYPFHPAARFVDWIPGVNRMCVIIDDGYRMYLED